MSPWKSRSRTRTVVLMDGVGKDRISDALAFRCVYSGNECVLRQHGAGYRRGRRRRGLTQVATFTFALAPDERLRSLVGSFPGLAMDMHSKLSC